MRDVDLLVNHTHTIDQIRRSLWSLAGDGPPFSQDGNQCMRYLYIDSYYYVHYIYIHTYTYTYDQGLGACKLFGNCSAL